MPLKLAIVGRPNVGKSTLFNRIAGKRLAIVDDSPGVTRDWRMADGSLYGEDITLIDTAGLENANDDSIESRMRKQTEHALDHAHVILFVIDGRDGVTPMDEHFARWLRKRKIPVILAVNKCETHNVAMSVEGDAYRLGMGDPVILSAEHGLGMDNLLDVLMPYIEQYRDVIDEDDELGEGDIGFKGNLDEIEGDEEFDFTLLEAANEEADGDAEDNAGEVGAVDQVDTEEDKELRPIKIAIVGRPNAGKSTLLNTLVNDERVMTGPEAGITRDAITVSWEYEGQPFRLVDTAGLRRKARIKQKLEKMAADDTIRAIRLAQAVILMLDANLTLEKQDLMIANHVVSEGRILILAINKWDDVRGKKEILQIIQDRLLRSFGQIDHVPMVTISALKGRNIGKLMDTVMETYQIWNKRIPTGGLNRWIARMESHHPAPLVQGRPNRLRYITQIKSRPPTFAMWVSRPDGLPAAYKRYIINGLRKDYDLHGVPVRLLIRTSKNPYT